MRIPALLTSALLAALWATPNAVAQDCETKAKTVSKPITCEVVQTPTTIVRTKVAPTSVAKPVALQAAGCDDAKSSCTQAAKTVAAQPTSISSCANLKAVPVGIEVQDTGTCTVLATPVAAQSASGATSACETTKAAPVAVTNQCCTETKASPVAVLVQDTACTAQASPVATTQCCTETNATPVAVLVQDSGACTALASPVAVTNQCCTETKAAPVAVLVQDAGECCAETNAAPVATATKGSLGVLIEDVQVDAELGRIFETIELQENEPVFIALDDVTAANQIGLELQDLGLQDIGFDFRGLGQDDATAESKKIGDELRALGYAAEADDDAIESLMALGYLAGDSDDERGYMGIEMEVREGAMVVTNVMDGSPAASVGLKAGDRITSVGDHKVTNLESLTGHLSKLHAGDKVGIRVVRDGWVKEMKIKLVSLESIPRAVEARDEAVDRKEGEVRRRIEVEKRAADEARAEAERRGAETRARAELRRAEAEAKRAEARAKAELKRAEARAKADQKRADAEAKAMKEKKTKEKAEKEMAVRKKLQKVESDGGHEVFHFGDGEGHADVEVLQSGDGIIVLRSAGGDGEMKFGIGDGERLVELFGGDGERFEIKLDGNIAIGEGKNVWRFGGQEGEGDVEIEVHVETDGVDVSDFDVFRARGGNVELDGDFDDLKAKIRAKVEGAGAGHEGEHRVRRIQIGEGAHDDEAPKWDTRTIRGQVGGTHVRTAPPSSGRFIEHEAEHDAPRRAVGRLLPPAADRDLEGEIEALRREIEELRKLISELRERRSR